MKQQKTTLKIIFLAVFTFILYGFAQLQPKSTAQTLKTEKEQLSYLALGDSYTIGESVAENKRWPVQLAAVLNANKLVVQKPEIIAKTGWRTDQVLSAARHQLGSKTFDIVSLLIGVNNEFQGKSLTSFETEFETCLSYAIQKCDNGKKGVFVLSIPDYGYTPFGEYNQSKISKRIQEYNQVCKTISAKLGVTYYDITPISQRGLKEPILVASDGLHPSGEQYRRWIETYSEALFLQCAQVQLHEIVQLTTE